MTLNQFLKRTENSRFLLRPKVHCNDGFKFFIQSSKFHKSTESKTGARFYETLELILEKGSNTPNQLTKYKNLDKYEYVPYEIVWDMVQVHNGINEDLTFKISYNVDK